jgi:ribosomal protein L3 glutamine methyltransferase
LRSAPSTAPRTVGAWWRELERRFARAGLFFGHGTENARDEAAWLVCGALDIPFEHLQHALTRPVDPAAARRLETIARRREATRTPLAYLLHEAWLGNHRFYVDERVIVPRSHIAELLYAALAPWIAHTGRVQHVLDLCTGSGCLAILAALAFPSASIDATDISRDALQVARKNVAAYRLKDRVRLVRSDVFNALAGDRYDVIVCNPPYVSVRAMRTLPPEYRHEPRVALAGGKDGLDFVRALLAEVAQHMKKDGLMVVEIGDGRAALERAFPALPFTWLKTSAADSSVFLLRRGDLAG